MKRTGNIIDKICNTDALQMAGRLAAKGKAKRPDVMAYFENEAENVLNLHRMLTDKTYTCSPYRNFIVHEPKKREISALPFYPDRVIHYATVLATEPVFMSYFTTNTYSSIKGRGTHKMAADIRKALRDEKATTYCLKLDIQKFYPSVDHDILKCMLRRKFKDKDLLWLFDTIIDSAPGLPIGNLPSQFLANFYLTGFDHWVKECEGVRHYYRYCDDIVIVHESKEYLHGLLRRIERYLWDILKLRVKGNWQVFPVAARGIDVAGYKIYHTHTLVRKGIKKNFCRMLKRNPNQKSIASYYGWLKHCNSVNLLNKLLPNEQFQGLQYTSADKRI